MFPWEIGFLIGAVVLGGVLAWAMWRVAHRNKANDALTEAATREEYDHPDTYMQGRRQNIDKQIRPS